jgi:antitoxin (DNA-binding transcriptional repressor) of toxin-antitoxin stability system
MTQQEIEIPEDMAFLSKLMERAEAGLITYLTHQGRRIGVVVPADVVDAVRQAFVEPEDDLVLSEAESNAGSTNWPRNRAWSR